MPDSKLKTTDAPHQMGPRKRAMIRVLLVERMTSIAVADIDAALAAADAVDPLRISAKVDWQREVLRRKY